jgi:hypothetical protein
MNQKELSSRGQDGRTSGTRSRSGSGLETGRRRTRLGGMAAAIGLAMPGVVSTGHGVAGLAVGALILGGLGVALWVQRCPECGRRLGPIIGFRNCASCGCRLSGAAGPTSNQGLGVVE